MAEKKLYERIAKVRAEVVRQTALALGFLTPRQVGEWKNDEHLGYLVDCMGNVENCLDTPVEHLREAEMTAMERGL